MKKNIFCALDLDFKSALSLTKQIKDHIYGIKIGSLFNQIGIEGLKEFDQLDLPIFVDSKFSDIPSTTARNISNLKELKNIANQVRCAHQNTLPIFRWILINPKFIIPNFYFGRKI